MEFWKFMFVPTVLFLTVVAPVWIIMHYRSVNRSSRGLRLEDRAALDHMLESVDKLSARIGALEQILDDDHPGWRHRSGRDQGAAGDTVQERR